MWHDLHTSNLLGAARVLTGMKDKLEGNIVFCFQPAEEDSPVGGAKAMIAEGALENPSVDAALAFHVYGSQTGTLSINRGVATAESNPFYIKIIGKSAHASSPHEGKDAITCAAQVVSALQTIVSRQVDPFDSAVVTIGKIDGGDRYNVLAEEVILQGTVRLFNPELSAMMEEKIEAVVSGVCQAMGCGYRYEYVHGYKNVINDDDIYDYVYQAASAQLGEEAVISLDKPKAVGEDFAAFSAAVPSVYAWLGVESDFNRGKAILHSSEFLADEKALLTGIQAMSAIAYAYVNEDKSLLEKLDLYDHVGACK